MSVMGRDVNLYSYKIYRIATNDFLYVFCLKLYVIHGPTFTDYVYVYIFLFRVYVETDSYIFK